MFCRVEDGHDEEERQDGLKPNEIRLKGPASSVSLAIAEIQELVEYEVKKSTAVK
jgi:hypothetical protein